MIIPDTNLLIYAYNKRAAQHERARRWWDELLSGSVKVGVPWVVALGFIRLLTLRAVLAEPIPVTECTERVREWFACDNVTPLDPGPRHFEILSSLLQHVGVGGNLVTDVHLAALAIEHDAELHSNDADFSRIPGLKHFNPLVSS